MQARIAELEIRLTHQEATLESLGQTVFEQSKLIDSLGIRIQRLEARLRELGGSNIATESEETPPPHY